MTRTCFRCGEAIREPTEEYAAYVSADDTSVTEMVEVTEAVIHTDATKNALSSLQADHYPETDLDLLEKAIASSTDLISYLGTPPEDSSNDPSTREANAKSVAPALSEFDRQEIADVSDAPSGTVTVEQSFKEKTIQKTGLVHSDCKVSSDTVIWS